MSKMLEQDNYRKYSDSIIPLGIGASFFLILLTLFAAGTVAGLLLGKDNELHQQLGGVPLLLVFLVLTVGPLLYNRKRSRFEANREIKQKHDFLGTIQGLRGVFFRLLIYEDGFEIRAFYHRYFIPFREIRKISIIENKLSTALKFPTNLYLIPNRIDSSGDAFRAMSLIIQKKVEPGHL